MDISVIIPTHQRTDKVKELLLSLSRQETKALRIEVIVVSNLADQELEKSLKDSRAKNFYLKYIVSGGKGVNKARNCGISKSEANLILFLDDDVIIPDKHYLQKIYSHTGTYPHAAAIGGRYKLPEKVNNSDKAYFVISNAWLSQGQNQDASAIHLVGGNTLYNKQVLKHRLYFNENISFGGAETELNLKIYQAQLAMYLCEDIPVVHVTQLNPFRLLKKALYQGLGRAYHEQVVHPDIWKRKEISQIPERNLLPGREWSMRWQRLLISWFDSCFRIGYLHGKLSDVKKIRCLLLLKCFLIEIFSLDPKNIITAPNSGTKYHLSPAIAQKIISTIPFWRIPWFFEHVVGSKLWRIPWLFNKWKFIKWKLLTPFDYLISKLWLLPWFFKYKFKPWFIGLFSGFWRIPWFMQWVLLIRIRGFKEEHTWKMPWLIRYRIWPVIPRIISKLWIVPYFIRWKIIDYLDFRRLSWWVIPWFFRNHLVSHLWRLPWLFKWRIVPIILFVTVFTVSMFFPVNTIGLLTYYAGVWNVWERSSQINFKQITHFFSKLIAKNS
jgi:glycosyltransferase involved in cell wall biosynthesis